VTETPRFIQGLFRFEGKGLERPVALKPVICYTVPFDRRAQLLYFRAGNSTAEMIYAVLHRDGKPMRYFPVAAKGAIHVSLRVVEDLNPDTKIEVLLGAPEGVIGSLLLDVGLVEI
jgi:hypothetical protein